MDELTINGETFEAGDVVAVRGENNRGVPFDLEAVEIVKVYSYLRDDWMDVTAPDSPGEPRGIAAQFVDEIEKVEE